MFRTLVVFICGALLGGLVVWKLPALGQTPATTKPAAKSVDVAALDVVDSYATHTLRNLANIAGLRCASTVIVGINPDVAFAISRLGMRADIAPTALDMDDAIAILDELTV